MITYLFVALTSSFAVASVPVSFGGVNNAALATYAHQISHRTQFKDGSAISHARRSAKKKRTCTESKSRVEIELTNNSEATIVFYRKYQAKKSKKKLQETLGTVPPASLRTFRARMRVGLNQFIYAPFCTISPVTAQDGSHAVVIKRVREKVSQRGTCTKKLQVAFDESSFIPSGFTCDKVAGAPFTLTDVKYTESVPVNNPFFEPLFISYTGQLEFPIKIHYVPRSCAPGQTCEAREHLLLAAPPSGDPLVFPKAIACSGNITAPLSFDFEVFVTDGRSRESNRLAAPFTCVP